MNCSKNSVLDYYICFVVYSGSAKNLPPCLISQTVLLCKIATFSFNDIYRFDEVCPTLTCLVCVTVSFVARFCCDSVQLLFYFAALEHKRFTSDRT